MWTITDWLGNLSLENQSMKKEIRVTKISLESLNALIAIGYKVIIV